MRLIDATDAEKWAMGHLWDAPERYAICDFLRNCSTVDAVEVVRCKNCEYSRPLTTTEKKIYLDDCVVCLSGDASCTGYNVVWGDHFCSYGERKDDEPV